MRDSGGKSSKIGPGRQKGPKRARGSENRIKVPPEGAKMEPQGSPNKDFELKMGTDTQINED